MRRLVLLSLLFLACGPQQALVGGGDGDAVSGTTAELGANAARVVGSQFPAELRCGERATASVTVQNAGTKTWTAADGYKLGTAGDEDALHPWDTRELMPEDAAVPPGGRITFTFDLEAPGQEQDVVTDWRMVLEHVEWFGDVAKATVRVRCGGAQPPSGPPPPAGGTVELCPGVAVDTSGRVPATAALQACVDATPSGGTLELPPGTYLMDGQVLLTHPMTLRTAGTAASATACEDGEACAVLKAAADLFVMNGFVALHGEGITLDHVVLDGDRGARLGSAAAATCAGGNNRVGMNATGHCTNCTFTYGTSKNALCGSGFEWFGDGATVIGAVFRDNGDNGKHMMWSDGLTLLQSDGAVVRHNRFMDNSDIGFISGGSRGGYFAYNVISQSRQLAFGGLMLDNFNGHTHGDFDGAEVVGNHVLCNARQCDYGVVVGPHAWYQSANTRGGEVHGNIVHGAKTGIIVEGGGTPDAPLHLYGNDVQVSGGSASFLCGARDTAALVVSHSSVDRHGESSAVSGAAVHDCP